ncbi:MULTISPECIES: TonB-dependent siderophore receptor [unclassified Sphingopyxis]|jgi:iron complex outermembrane receptor protein|uniref:TonB-dependent receptor n=1 Tax=unclassified Sphingopyxis TaxID=2614943 RepID=UPI0006C20B36|nr:MULTISPECIES: TonB-dependent receptor [unclassified Sphingopyxis]USI77383.1 TonB-dependent receptor [Sphingopyxis sp. USTB-05]GAO80136.1 ferrichrome-iron receptor [Sphingopyxis sp. C-1]
MTKSTVRTALGLSAATAVLAAATPAMAQEGAAGEEIIVTAQRNNQTKVTGGGNVGVFGTKAAEDIPFNIRSYNEALILNQQPDTLGEVLENDPTVRTALGFGIAGEVFVIRGFDLSSDDVGFDGLYGVTPRQLVAPELFSSVQVINGASAFLNGAAPGGSGIGGSVNLIPKKAERDMVRATLGYTSASHISGAVDVARRFGANGEWGLRINGSARRGDIAIDEEFHSSYVLGATLDYNNGPLRTSLNLNYQRLNQKYWRGQVGIGGVVPRVPDADTNYSQPWSQILTKDFFGTFSIEYDVSDQAMLYAKVGARDGREDQTTASITVLDAVTGAATGSGSYVPREDNNESATAGIRIKLEGGGMSHEINAGAAVSWQVNRNAYDFSATNYATNLYDPVIAPAPTPGGFVGGDIDDVFPISRNRVSSVFFSDTLGLWDDRILITGGLRLQEIKTTSYSYFGGARTGGYKESAATPVFGLVIKPVEGLSLYANRIEGLVAGSTAPVTIDDGQGNDLPVTNGGAVLPPVKSKQYEVGGKLNFGRFNAGLALFQIDKPNSFVDPVRLIYGNYGTQRNRGVEITLDGEPVDGLRIISGLTFNDAKLRRTEGGVNEGNDAIGVPDVLANANVEWDLPFLPALTLVGRVVYTGKQAVDAANTLELDSWTRFDLGARYVALVGDTPLTLRFNVDNVADKRYWASAYNAFSAFGSRLLQGGPRTFKASASIEF